VYLLPRCTPGSAPAIAPFWADAYTINSGSVYYRKSSALLDQLKAKTEILAAFPLLLTLTCDDLIIVTWKNVQFYGSQNCPNSGGITNTFQAILVRGGSLSFTIFYYNDIEWSAALGAQCNGTTAPKSAQVGFDNGQGNFFGIPSSCTADVLNIGGQSNVNQGGKFVFQIDTLYQDTNCGLLCTLLGTLTRIG